MNMEIDTKIGLLNYDPEQVLAYRGDNISNFKPNEGILKSGKYIVITKEKISLDSKEGNIGVFTSIANVAYPGALLLGNSKLVENHPEPITVARKPLKFVIDLPGMEQEGIFTTKDPSYGEVAAAVQQKFDDWTKNYASSHSIAARSNYSESMVYSESEMVAKFGFGIKKTIKSLNIDFQSINKGQKSVFISAFHQIFYTVSIDNLPEHPSDLLSDDVSWEDLQRFGVDNDNPPVMVSNVCYGRTIYIKMESSSTESDVEGAFKAITSGTDISGNARYKEILKNTSYSAVILGGGTTEMDELIKISDYTKIKDVITKYSECNSNNPGYPISYTTIFLKNNNTATINSTTEYIKTTTTEYNNAVVKLNHTGGYIAQFKVTWDEITYDKQGHKKVTHKGWDDNLKNLTAPFSTEITLQGNSENLCVFAKECTGIAWEWWRTVFDKKNVPLVPNRKFNIYGTTLNQKYSIDPDI